MNIAWKDCSKKRPEFGVWVLVACRQLGGTSMKVAKLTPDLRWLGRSQQEFLNVIQWRRLPEVKPERLADIRICS